MELSLGRNSLAERITSEILWQNRSNRKSFGRTDQIGNSLAEQIKSEILWQNRSNRKSFGRTDQIGNPLASEDDIHK